MNKRKLLALVLTGVMAISTLAGCGSSDTKTSDTDVKTSETAETSDKNVLRVGMECAYAPFNWTQDSDTTPDGSKAVPIYGSDYYAYGYDVAVAQKLADEMGMDLEVHKVEWSSIGISLDAGDYDVIIAGMGKTAEREASYSFTEPYYYRDNLSRTKISRKAHFSRVTEVVECRQMCWNLHRMQHICSRYATKILICIGHFSVEILGNVLFFV